MKLTTPFSECSYFSVVMLNVVMLSVVVPQAILLVYAGNTNCRGRLNTVDLLIKVACFVKTKIMLIKSSRSKLISARRSIVVSFPLFMRFFLFNVLWIFKLSINIIHP